MSPIIKVLNKASWLLLFAIFIFLFEGMGIAINASNIPLLTDHANAHWIKYDAPVDLVAKRVKPGKVLFLRSVPVSGPQRTLIIKMLAYRSASI